MSEPFFIQQTAEPEDIADIPKWFQVCGDEAHEKGAKFVRYSIDDIKDPKMAIVEGWDEKPEDQGEIRWQFNQGERE